MRCHGCQQENPTGSRFCGGCGEALVSTVACSGCGFENPVQHRFCSQCGASVGGEAGARRAPERTAQGERRHITVMFCDLVGSTSLSEELDPEDLHAVMTAYHESCSQVVERYEGFVSQYLGDGLLVYFGYPRAHEDDAQRAVRAALGILSALDPLNQRLTARGLPTLSARVGIHSGTIVVRDTALGEKQDQLAVGRTVNVAARLEGLAEPNTAVISADTLRLVQGLFVTHDRGDHALKGIEAPVRVHQVLRASGVRSRFDVVGASGLTPLVGREQELALLLDRWERAGTSQGQAVLLCGEAGMGKSRLVAALRQQLGSSAHTWLECRGSDYNRHSALYPIIEMQQQGMRFADADAPEERLDKLSRALRSVDMSPDEWLPTFAGLHSLPLPAGAPPQNLSPEAQRRRTLEGLVRWLLEMGRQQPVVFLVEDLHWVDPSTLELLGMLLRGLPSERVMVLLTYRPTFRVPWSGDPHLTPMLLSRLPRAQASEMVRRRAGAEKLPSAWVDEIVRRTDGNPLYLEELTKSVLEREGGRADRKGLLEIPATLQDSLTARLDQLGAAKQTAQLGAVLGREFSHDLLRAVSPLGDDALETLVARLVSAEIFFRSDRSAERRYLFKHALIQEAAYQSLLKSDRQQHHGQIGNVLAERFTDVAEAQPELLAHHFTEGGEHVRAIGYWQQAGQRAIVRSSNEEAANHLERALELVANLPESRERIQQELGVRTLLGLSLIAIRGYGSDDAAQNFGHARDLCAALGETPELFAVLSGLWLFYLVRSEPGPTEELATQLLEMAERSGADGLLLQAHAAKATNAYWRGDHRNVRGHAESALSIYDPKRHAAHAYLFGQDPAVFSRLYIGMSEWFLGHPDRALTHVHEAIALAEKINHPFTLAAALSMLTDLHYRRREPELERIAAEKLYDLATEQVFPLWTSGARTTLAWLRAVAGEVEEGIEDLQEALESVAATGSQMNGPYVRSKLMQAYLDAGRREPGLAVAAQAIARSAEQHDTYWEPELYRQQGELLRLEPEDRDAAERCFQASLTLSRDRGARALELRAATSLARLWHDTGRSGGALALLEPLLGSFDEGLELPDLREARQLLERLHSAT